MEVDHEAVGLLTSEVATNVVRHAHTAFGVRVQCRDRSVRVEVSNSAPELLLIRKHPSHQGGRGLHIIDRLAQRWGVEAQGDHKVVWFESGSSDTGSTKR